MKAFYVFLLFGIHFLAGPMAQAQEAKYKGVLMYQFTRYLEWKAPGSEFEIFVLGNSSVTPVLKEIASKKTVGTNKISVKTSSQIGDAKGAEMIFVPAAKKDALAEVLAAVKGKQVLIITESPGQAAAGSGINFVQKDGKVSFELHKSNLSKNLLKSSLSLERLAAKVY